MKYIAYYRVSTKEQENSHLGLEAQRKTVEQYIKFNGNRIIAEFTEVESGRNNNRTELKRAISLANKEQATLVIARLDRLSRSVTLVSTLLDTKVKFICCDMPMADETTIYLIAAFAQREVKLISERTKQALDAKRIKEPDWKPGTNNLTDEMRAKAHLSTSLKARTDTDVRKAWHFIKPRREQGISFQKIADELNAEGYPTRKKLPFHKMQVYNIWKRFQTE